MFFDYENIVIYLHYWKGIYFQWLNVMQDYLMCDNFQYAMQLKFGDKTFLYFNQML